MPNEKRPQVKNDKKYEAMKREGMSKEKAARIANTPDSGKKEAVPPSMKSGQKKISIRKLRK